ncbi:carbohydrate-binding protein [Streptomyces candidus]|uniref:Streptogrisin C n=1 Tax=Streptomyces candidus TaxID=67283 RepID=A0A7X0HEE7_9ACTN|nr:carbohydrate-binding protein [Streptomyces candidus]MBB6436001.1 streptogrisin C [Streptomyces candidus]GHH43296.1 serine protease [Streptomyces candidus]
MVHRHFGGAARVSLTVLGAVALTGLPAAAAVEPPAPSSAQTLGAGSPSPAVLHAMKRDLGLTGTQARARLVNEAEAGTRAGKLQNALGKRFAGAWVKGPTSAVLTVATTEAADVPTITAGGAKAVVVKNTLEDLESVKAKVDAAAGQALDTPVRYVDVRTNRVIVQATSRAAARTLVTNAGVNRQQVQVKVSADRPRALHDVRGGDAYYIDEKARCSVGFSVTKGEQQGFASAGHCGKKGAKTTGFNKVAQGSFEGSAFPGKDMSWVSVSSEWTATSAVKGKDDKDVQVTGSVEALVGAAICRSGSTTGWHCGTIEQHGTSVTYAEGVVEGVTRTTVCAEPGDSGGPYLSGTQAQGITSGGSGDCKSGGVTFHQPVNPLLTEFGLTLKTAAEESTPGVQARPAGKWSPGKVYGTGVRVVHNGVAYECLQSHQAQGVWQPARTPALWQRV